MNLETAFTMDTSSIKFGKELPRDWKRLQEYGCQTFDDLYR